MWPVLTEPRTAGYHREFVETEPAQEDLDTWWC